MIDLHCHILPGLDDGSRSMPESLAMAERAVADGIRTLVATPHTLNGLYRNPTREIIRCVGILREALEEKGIDLRVLPGADIHICPRMRERIEAGEACTVNNGNRYLLLELPSQNLPAGIREEIFGLKLSGITPIITHPERHMILQQDAAFLSELVNMGALVQVTAMSITGEFGEGVRECTEGLLARRLVHFIASDAHSADSRPPVLSPAVEAAAEILGDREEAVQMVTTRPAAVLAGDPVEIPEPLG